MIASAKPADALKLRLAEGWKAPDAQANWLASEPVFAESAAYERLYRSLRRYLSEEISGSSFLIAGHRGAGKTTTVGHAVRRLRNDALLDSTAAHSAGFGRRRALQRPLLVKLVGKSLIEPPPGLTEREKRQGATGADEPRNRGRETPPGTAGPDPGSAAAIPSSAAEGDEDEGLAGHALAHITIALYRALSAEVVRAFTTHAKDERGPDRSEKLELAAQLSLELDSNPDPAGLRNLWHCLGRLGNGVFWPAESGYTLRRLALDDQGMREIVSIATAAQAFQVCSGEVSYTLTNKDTASSERESKSTLDVKDLAARISALAVGTAAGSATAFAPGGGALTGVGIGVLAFLLSTMSLSRSTTRKRFSSRDLEYKFIRDRSLQTLDRDLPVVIDRLRQAGLAPVFVIDELDKLDNTARIVTLLIGRLKHLISDHGFFCFLSDRGYFEEVEAKIASEAYPKESTYFSDRLLVLNRPTDLYEYLSELIVDGNSKPIESDSAINLRFAKATLALSVMFRSKLNFTDVSRRLAELLDAHGFFTPTERNIVEPKALRLAATVQLAIMDVVRHPKIADRFASNPAFAHQMIDALYHIPRCWEKDPSNGCTLSKERLKCILVERVAQSLGGGSVNMAGNRRKAELLVKDDDVLLMFEMVLELAKRLASFSDLKQSIAASEMEDAALFSDIICIDQGSLLEGIDPKSAGDALVDDREPKASSGDQEKSTAIEYSYSFRFTSEGNPVGETEHPDPLDPARRAEIRSLCSFLKRVIAVIEGCGLSIDALMNAELLDRSLTSSRVAAAIANLDKRAAQNLAESGMAADIEDAKSIRSALERSWPGLMEVLWLVGSVQRDAHKKMNAVDVLTRIKFYFRKGPTPSPIAVPSEIRALTLDREASADELLKQLRSEQDKPSLIPFATREAERWAAWRNNVVNHIAEGVTPKVNYDDLVQAAVEEVPGSIFRSDLDAMTVDDWSALVFAGLPKDYQREPGTHAWTVAAGLAQLGFGPLDFLLTDEAALFVQRGGPPEAQALETIIRLAVSGGPGLLYSHSRSFYPTFLPLTERESRPLLAVASYNELAYSEALGWLTAVGLLQGIVREDDDDGKAG